MRARLTLLLVVIAAALACEPPPAPPPAPPAPELFDGVAAPPPEAEPVRFQFVRLRVPGEGTAEQIRIGLDDRVRSAARAVETRTAPSYATLSRLEAVCADASVVELLRPATAMTASMATVEVACGGVAGFVGCEPGATCAPAFTMLRALVEGAWAEDLPRPARGIVLVGDGAATAFVIDAQGRQRGAATARSAPAGTTAVVCSALDTCVRATAPERIEVDALGAGRRLRCASCGPARPPMRLVPGPFVVLGSLDKAIIERVVRSHEAAALQCVADADAMTLPIALEMKWVINGEGMVTQAVTVEEKPAQARSGACLARQIRTWRFPRPKGGGIVIVKAQFQLLAGT